MKISWPNSLINDIARRRCVIFLGSGISRNSVNATGLHPKTWVEALESGMQQLDNSIQRNIKRHILSKNFLMACELIRYSMGRDNFVRCSNHPIIFQATKMHRVFFDFWIVRRIFINNIVNLLIRMVFFQIFVEEIGIISGIHAPFV